MDLSCLMLVKKAAGHVGGGRGARDEVVPVMVSIAMEEGEGAPAAAASSNNMRRGGLVWWPAGGSGRPWPWVASCGR